MSTLSFDAASFRAQFPGEFIDPPNTNALLELYWNVAICYVSPETGGTMTVECRQTVLNYVTAHVLKVSQSSANDEQIGFIEQGQIDKISVTILSMDATPNAFTLFLLATPYGMAALGILSAHTNAGFYVGGRNELGSFRRSGGVFTPPSVSVAEVAPTDQCPILSVPVDAPYSLDLGEIAGGSFLDTPLTILAGCFPFTLSFTSAAFASAITLSMWSSFAADAGQRFNAFYFDSAGVFANSAPQAIIPGIDPTGIDQANGFIQSGGMLTGGTLNDPNLFVFTGWRNLDAQVLNVRVAVA